MLCVHVVAMEQPAGNGLEHFPNIDPGRRTGDDHGDAGATDQQDAGRKSLAGKPKDDKDQSCSRSQDDQDYAHRLGGPRPELATSEPQICNEPDFERKSNGDPSIALGH